MVRKIIKTLVRIIIALLEIVLGWVSLYALHQIFVTNISPGGVRISNIIELFYLKDYASILLFAALAMIPFLTLLAGVGLLVGTSWGAGLSVCCTIFWLGLLVFYSYFILPKETTPSWIKVYEQLNTYLQQFSDHLQQWWRSFLDLCSGFLKRN